MRNITRWMIALLLLMLLLNTALYAQDAPNLLTNPSFETPFIANELDDQVAEGWQAWSIGDAADRPAFSENTTRIFSGTSAQEYTTFFALHTAGLYQSVSGITVGDTLTFNAYVYVWSTRDLSNPDLSVSPGMVEVKVGIDPTGGTDPESTEIAWSIPVEEYDSWILHTVSIPAQSDTVTVWVRSSAAEARLETHVYVDEASLIVGDAGSQIIPPEITQEPEITEEASVAPEITPEATPNLTLTATPPQLIDLPTADPTIAAIATSGQLTLEAVMTMAPTATISIDDPTRTLEAQQTLDAANLTATQIANDALATAAASNMLATQIANDALATAAASNMTATQMALDALSTANAVNDANAQTATAVMLQATVDAANLMGTADAVAMTLTAQAQQPQATATPQVIIVTATQSAPLAATPTVDPAIIAIATAGQQTLEAQLNGSNAQPTAAVPTVAPLVLSPMPTIDTVSIFAQFPYRVQYTVQAGDTVFALAQLYGSTIEAIIAVNGLDASGFLNVGQVLVIPANAVPNLPGTGGQGQPPSIVGPTQAYIVTFGDNLTDIAARFNTTAATLAQLNGITSVNTLRAGQTLLVPLQPTQPATRSYTVQYGDSLYTIALKYGVTIQQIAQLNNIQNVFRIYPGQVLRIP